MDNSEKLATLGTQYEDKQSKKPWLQHRINVSLLDKFLRQQLDSVQKIIVNDKSWYKKCICTIVSYGEVQHFVLSNVSMLWCPLRFPHSNRNPNIHSWNGNDGSFSILLIFLFFSLSQTKILLDLAIWVIYIYIYYLELPLLNSWY
jgi:hypothetical protein